MEIDETIGQVSHLYRALTGNEIPVSETPYAPIPAEKDPVEHVQQQMDRLLGLLSGPNGQSHGVRWVPPIAIYESASEIVVAVYTPGASRDHVDVHLESGVLIVAGQRAPSPADGQTLRHTEVRFGPFRRAVPLPPGLRTSDMSARIEAGVVEVRIPRDGAGGVRHINIS